MFQLVIKPFAELSNLEVYHMIRIREEVFILEQNCVYVDCDNNDPLCDHLLVYEGDILVGTLRILPKGVKYEHVSIGRVVVVKEARKKGLASSMMEKALEFAFAKYGEIDIVLSAQVAIKGLYEKAGFISVSDIYLEDGIDHVKMLYKPKN
jgi:ElaA protein